MFSSLLFYDKLKPSLTLYIRVYYKNSSYLRLLEDQAAIVISFTVSRY